MIVPTFGILIVYDIMETRCKHQRRYANYI